MMKLLKILLFAIFPALCWSCNIAAATPLPAPTDQADGLAPPETDVPLRRWLASHRQQEVSRLNQKGEELYEGASEQAAVLFANAYALGHMPISLRRAADSCLRAGLDVEALALYQNLTMQEADPDSKAELDVRIAGLRAQVMYDSAIVTQVTKGYVRRGIDSVRSGDFRSAWEAFSLAYSMSPEPLPRLLFNIGQAYRRAGRAEVACLSYSRFLTEDPHSELRKEALAYLQELRAVAFAPPLRRRPWFIGLLTAASVGLTTGIIALTLTLVPKPLPTTLGSLSITFP